MFQDPLSQRLLASVSRDFFRPLTRPTTALYVDCAENLVILAGEAGRIPHADAVALIREILAKHPGLALADDEGGNLRDARQRAGQIFNRLCDARWIEDQQLGLHERWILISPGLRPLLRMLRELAEDEIAELKTFADSVRSVCETLERDNVLDPFFHEPDALRSDVTDLNVRLENAIIQLHGVEKLISIYDQRQRASESPAETLRLLYMEFSSGQHMVCYDSLRRGGLLPRLQAARSLVADRRDNPMVKERLAEAYTAHYGWDADEAYARSEKALRDLEHKLASIRHVADAIDGRMAGFNRLSQQRYRYQTELRGRRPEIVKGYCDALNATLAGTRMAAMREEAPDFAPLIPEMRCFFGVESLARTRRVKARPDLSFTETANRIGDEDDTLAALRERQRLALTPQRAARLVAKFLPPSEKTESGNIEVEDIDGLLDLLAIAAYDHATTANGSTIRWSVDGPRRGLGLTPEQVPYDSQLDWRMERFTITRTV